MVQVDPPFGRLALQLASSFKAVIRTWVAVRHGGVWEIRYSRLLLTRSLPDAGLFARKVETPSIKAQRTVERLNDPLTWIESALRDPLINLEDVLETQFPGQSRTAFFRLHPPENPGNMRLATFRVQAERITGAGATKTEQLDLELLAHTSPYEGMKDLYQDLNLPTEAAEDQAPSTAEMILLPVAEIDAQSSLADDVLKAMLFAAPGTDKGGLKVGVKAFGVEGIRRFSLSGADFDWREDNEVWIASLEVPLKAAPMALLVLSYRGEFLHRWWLRDQSRSFNRAYDLQRTVDKHDTFSKGFFSDRNDFEERTALLLSLLGATPLFYGKIPQLTDAPDILALSPEGHLYVIECTTGDINAKGKLQRLSHRTRALAALLENSPSRPKAILPVVFTSSPRAETIPHWSVAENLGIALVCREEISHLLTLLPAPPTADAFFDDALKLIPSSPDRSSTQRGGE